LEESGKCVSGLYNLIWFDIFNRNWVSPLWQ